MELHMDSNVYYLCHTHTHIYPVPRIKSIDSMTDLQGILFY